MERGQQLLQKKHKAPPDCSNLSPPWNKGLKLPVKALQTCHPQGTGEEPLQLGMYTENNSVSGDWQENSPEP